MTMTRTYKPNQPFPPPPQADFGNGVLSQQKKILTKTLNYFKKQKNKKTTKTPHLTMQPGLPLNSKSFCLLLGVRITDVCCYIWLNIPLGQKVATLTKGAILLVSATVKSIPTSTSKCQHFCSDRTDSQAQPSSVPRLQKACFPKELPQFYLLCCNLT